MLQQSIHKFISQIGNTKYQLYLAESLSCGTHQWKIIQQQKKQLSSVKKTWKNIKHRLLCEEINMKSYMWVTVVFGKFN